MRDTGGRVGDTRFKVQVAEWETQGSRYRWQSGRYKVQGTDGRVGDTT